MSASERLDHLLQLVALARAEEAAAQARAALVVRRSALDDAVYAARDSGATWEQIGTALGVTRARVHQKWGPSSNRRRIWERRQAGATSETSPAVAS